MKKSINILRQTLNHSKKAALLIALFLTIGISYSFASGAGDINHTATSGTDGINLHIRNSFRKDFSNAQILGSEVLSNCTKLTFKMNNVVLFAFYADNGELLAVTRNILSSQLPVNLLLNLKNNYSGYWITELFELSGGEQNCYYVALESADSKLILRSTDHNTWEVYEKKAKN